jgi:crotonobetainyl-CoA:carnitine CoA-transferase CaiB-like acyl-CoA transferase
VTGPPIKFSETPGATSTPAPILGQHSRDALAEILGLDKTTLDALADRGVIFQSRQS